MSTTAPSHNMVRGQGNLPQVRLALNSPGGFARLLDRRQQSGRERPDDGGRDQAS
jgi:hypothetical protein